MNRINESVVVLGGGGIWGVAWMTGAIMGLAEYGIDLTQARAFIGTSAGSIVGSQIAHGYSPKQLFTRQSDAAKQPRQHPQQNSGLARLMDLIQRQWEAPKHVPGRSRTWPWTPKQTVRPREKVKPPNA